MAEQWVIEERVLALDVYFRLDYKRRAEMSREDKAQLKAALVDLTEVLNRYRAGTGRGELTYKTVRRKLLDFQAAEPAPYMNKSGTYHKDQELWREYIDKPDALRDEAARIRISLQRPMGTANG